MWPLAPLRFDTEANGILRIALKTIRELHGWATA
jgi:hypothetical protein